MHDNVKYGHINQAELKSNIDPQECSICRIIISRGVAKLMHKEHITHSYIQSSLPVSPILMLSCFLPKNGTTKSWEEVIQMLSMGYQL